MEQLYYHIRIRKKDTSNYKYEYDLDKLSLEKYCEAYNNGKTFSVEGLIVDKTTIEEILIILTTISIDQWLDECYRNLSQGCIVFYKRSDAFKNIGDTIKNVTSDFVSFDNSNVKTNNMIKNNKIFIVHGRDENTLLQLKEFLSENNFVSIVLKDEAKDGKTIIEKIEELTDVGKAIVIYTPDDSGNLAVKIDNDGLKKRARQNVIFEHGYLCAKIGRENVICMVKNEVNEKIELPSDINGLLYIEIDNNGGWKYQLLKELNRI